MAVTGATTSARRPSCGNWGSACSSGTGGDLRGLAKEADGDVDRASRLLQEFHGIGPTGAAVFLREVQAVWPWVRPYLDERARAGARRVGLPDVDGQLVSLVPEQDLARFAAALVRISLLPRRDDPLGT